MNKKVPLQIMSDWNLVLILKRLQIYLSIRQLLLDPKSAGNKDWLHRYLRQSERNCDFDASFCWGCSYVSIKGVGGPHESLFGG